MAKSKLKKKVLKFLLSFPISFSLTVCPFTPGHIDVVINSIFTIEQPQGIIDSPIAEAQGLIYPVEPLSSEKNEIEVGSATDRTQSDNKFVANCSAYTADPGLSIVLCKFFSQPCRTYASRPTCAHPFRVGYAHSTIRESSGCSISRRVPARADRAA